MKCVIQGNISEIKDGLKVHIEWVHSIYEKFNQKRLTAMLSENNENVFKMLKKENINHKFYIQFKWPLYLKTNG